MIANRTYNVIFSWSGNTSIKGVNIYVNNSLVGNATASNTQTAKIYKSIFIGNGNIGAYAFDGKIDHVQIFNKVLNSTERASLYNSGSWLQYPF